MEFHQVVPGVLREIQGSRIPFTNFSIEEILKPDFGRRQITTGVLNLTMRRSHANENGHRTFNNRNITSRNNSRNITNNIIINNNNNNSNNKIKNQNDKDSLMRRKSAHSVDSLCDNAHSSVDTSRLVATPGSECGSDGEASNSSSCGSSPTSSPQSSSENKQLWPAWVYCTRYSDRPSSGPRSKKVHRKNKAAAAADDKRPRTAFSSEQLRILKQEFENSRYLTEMRRQTLARELDLNESQIKIWFQNKRAKNKKTSGEKNALAMELMAQGLYNHKTANDGEHSMKMEM